MSPYRQDPPQRTGSDRAWLAGADIGPGGPAAPEVVAARERYAWLREEASVASLLWVRGGDVWGRLREAGAELLPGSALLGAARAAAEEGGPDTHLLVLRGGVDELLLLDVESLLPLWAADVLAQGSELSVAVEHSGDVAGDLVVRRDGDVVRRVDLSWPDPGPGVEPPVGKPLPEEEGLHVGQGRDVDGLVVLERLAGLAVTRDLVEGTHGTLVRLDPEAESRLLGEEVPPPVTPEPSPAAGGQDAGRRRRWFSRR